MYNTAELLVNRLTEVEKLMIRAASIGTLDHLFDTHYKNEISALDPRAVFAEAVDLIQDQHRRTAAQDLFGLTWKF